MALSNYGMTIDEYNRMALGDKKYRITPKPMPRLQHWKAPGVEVALVYNDELPWDKDAGIVYKIVELRHWDIATLSMFFTWRIEGMDVSPYGLRICDSALHDMQEYQIDTHRRAAQLAILNEAHRLGII